MTEEAARITCPVCGTQYRWIADLAGHKLKCKCSAILRVPLTAGAITSIFPEAKPSTTQPVARTSDTSAYDLDLPAEQPLAPEPEAAPKRPILTRCPSCGLNVKPGTVICINCGFNLAEGTKIKTEVAAPSPGSGTDAAPAEEAEKTAGAASRNTTIGPSFGQMAAKVIRDKEERVKNEAAARKRYRYREVKLPLLFLGAGVLTVVWGSMKLAGEPLAGLYAALLLMGIEVMIMMPLLLVAVFIAASIEGISFGSLKTALIKLTAICVGPGTVADVLLLFLLPFMTLSIFTAIAAPIVIYTIFLGLPLMLLFELDMQEMRMTIGIAIVVRVAAFLAGGSIVANLLYPP